MIERRETLKKLSQIERILANPPQLILVLDNYRKETMALEIATMRTRAAIAASIFHSNLYPNQESRPIVCCFAGEHTADAPPGSVMVSLLLYQYRIPPDKIYTKKNTNTTRTDLMQLFATVQARRIESVLIVTTKDHVKRTETEVKNHFLRRDRKRKMPQIEVIGPLAEIIDYLKISDSLDSRILNSIKDAILLGKTDDLNSGFGETLAIGLATIPIRFLRKGLQNFAETRTHKYIPPELKRVQTLAEKAHKAAKK